MIPTYWHFGGPQTNKTDFSFDHVPEKTKWFTSPSPKYRTFNQVSISRMLNFELMAKDPQTFKENLPYERLQAKPKEKGTLESRSNAGGMRKQNNNNKYLRIQSYYPQKDRENIASTTPEKDAMMKEQNKNKALDIKKYDCRN